MTLFHTLFHVVTIDEEMLFDTLFQTILDVIVHVQ